MPSVIIHHNVKDRELWLRSGVREEVFGPIGVTDIRTFIDPTNPDRVGLTADIADLDAFAAFMQSDAAAQAMATDGVIPETVVMLLKS